jgi:hypothetical protein
MSATKLVPDEELAGLGAQRGPGSAEAYILLELREARSTGENVFALRVATLLSTSLPTAHSNTVQPTSFQARLLSDYRSGHNDTCGVDFLRQC